MKKPKRGDLVFVRWNDASSGDSWSSIPDVMRGGSTADRCMTFGMFAGTRKVKGRHVWIILGTVAGGPSAPEDAEICGQYHDIPEGCIYAWYKLKPGGRNA